MCRMARSRERHAIALKTPFFPSTPLSDGQIADCGVQIADCRLQTVTPGGTSVAPLYSRFCICNEPRSRQGRYKPADCSVANCPADCARGHRFQIADCSALSRLSLQIVRLQIADCQITDCSPSVSTRRLQIADCRLRAPGMDWERGDCRLQIVPSEGG